MPFWQKNYQRIGGGECGLVLKLALPIGDREVVAIGHHN